MCCVSTSRRVWRVISCCSPRKAAAAAPEVRKPKTVIRSSVVAYRDLLHRIQKPQHARFQHRPVVAESIGKVFQPLGRWIVHERRPRGGLGEIRGKGLGMVFGKKERQSPSVSITCIG